MLMKHGYIMLQKPQSLCGDKGEHRVARLLLGSVSMWLLEVVKVGLVVPPRKCWLLSFVSEASVGGSSFKG